jgi:hypothetical protein
MFLAVFPELFGLALSLGQALGIIAPLGKEFPKRLFEFGRVTQEETRWRKSVFPNDYSERKGSLEVERFPLEEVGHDSLSVQSLR